MRRHAAEKLAFLFGCAAAAGRLGVRGGPWLFAEITVWAQAVRFLVTFLLLGWLLFVMLVFSHSENNMIDGIFDRGQTDAESRCQHPRVSVQATILGALSVCWHRACDPPHRIAPAGAFPAGPQVAPQAPDDLLANGDAAVLLVPPWPLA